MHNKYNRLVIIWLEDVFVNNFLRYKTQMLNKAIITISINTFLQVIVIVLHFIEEHLPNRMKMVATNGEK